MQYDHYECRDCHEQTAIVPTQSATDGGWVEYAGADVARYCAFCGSTNIVKCMVVHIERIYSRELIS
jgi:hypothetical protein